MIFTPAGVDLGLLTFRYYGLILVAAGVIAALLTGWFCRRAGSRITVPDGYGWTLDALLWTLIPGLVAGRLYHVAAPSISSLAAGANTTFYLTHAFEILSFWEGGLGLPGALSGGLAGLYLYTRISGIPFSQFLDLASPGAALGWFLSAGGRHIVQEGYGPPAGVPWCVFIQPENRLPGYESFTCFHPLYAYEAGWDLLVFALLVYLVLNRWNSMAPGRVSSIFLASLALSRLITGFWRLDYSTVFGLNLDQIMMAVLLIISAVLIFLTGRTHRRIDHDSPGAVTI